ncbi:ABC transporter substrate-binding protein [Methanocaldococcus indicus]|uniref:ABC transporter substrate-binding protein n=1 Tax=Methanocaldococcus indicus TaxID=213231 RepID=UPI003C6D4C9C
MRKYVLIFMIIGLIIPIISLAGCTQQQESVTQESQNIVTTTNNNVADEYKTIKDMWGRDVKIKKNINRVALLDFTGTYIKVMKIWGIDDKVVAVDHSQMKNPFLKVICPRLETDIVDVGNSREPNYETLAATKPDVVIVRAFVTNKNREEAYKKLVEKLNSLGIPVVILLHPTSYEQPNVKTMWEEIRILGEIFDKKDEANNLISYLNGYVVLIKNRTKDIPENERVRTLLFATPDYMLGKRTIQSYFLEDIVGGKNVVEEGSWLKTSPEDIIKLNPDALIILGHAGYLPPEYVYEGKDFGINWKLVQSINAIKNKKVGSLGITEWRATIEFPIGLLREAKTLYPDRFEDIDPDKEEIKLYRDIYHLNDKQIEEAIKAQRTMLNPH